jgi:hypothetical protein
LAITLPDSSRRQAGVDHKGRPEIDFRQKPLILMKILLVEWDSFWLE